MKKRKYLCFGIVIAMLFTITGCQSSNKSELDASHPTHITVWHYYNGAQLDSFNRLVDKFNNTVGKEKGVVVEASSQGTVNNLENHILDSIHGKVGAEKMPNIFAAYADTAYKVDQMGYVQNLNAYFTKEERKQYIDSYIDEGVFKGQLKIFPVAKSTEVIMLNKTDWDKFSQACHVSTSTLSTYEGLVKTAKQYYDWTDSLTTEANDGKALFGRDAMANYFIVGLKQHGIDVFSVDKKGKVKLNFDKKVVRKLWDNYYVPYIKGYFTSSGRFRSDDIKTGNVLCYIGSSSSATYFPKTVYDDNESSHDITSTVLPAPTFKGQNKVAVQQGAGMVVTKAKKKKIEACKEFLKWFTQDKQNIDFSISSGYLPVTKSGNQIKKVRKYTSKKNAGDVVEVAVKTVNTSKMYTSKAFENGTSARKVLEYSLQDKASADRQNVVKYLDEGMDYQTVIDMFDNDENFNDWYNETYQKLQSLVK